MESSESVGKGNLLSAMFLVGGTCIGGGMLALPVATGISGFLPSLLVMVVCWLAMTATGLLLLEVSMWLPEGAHIISMTSSILGFPAKIISWCLYLFICYASLVAYTAGGGVQIASAFHDYFGLGISKDFGSVIFILFFGAVVYLGSYIVGRVNAILFIGMVAAYVGLVGIGLPKVHGELLLHTYWPTSLMAVPMLLTSFSYQTMVPSLTPYLKRNAKALRWSVVGGTFIAFVIYAIWQSLILGIVPVEGANGLRQALIVGEPATQFLREHVDSRLICGIAEYFAFFAIVTSFLGIGLGLFDFLADGLNIKKAGLGNVILGILIIIPTMIFAIRFERAFIVALDASGGFGDSILNGIIPVLMVWVGRYHLGLGREQKSWLPGGKPVLTALLGFFIFTFGLATLIQLGYIQGISGTFEPPIHNIKEAEAD